MKRIYLLRHAKAQMVSGINDKLRPLSLEGEEDAYQLGAFMRKKDYTPDAIFCSSALRTQQTYDQITKAFKVRITKYDENDLYNALAEEIIDVIHRADDQMQSILILAHNPGLHELALRLCDLETTPLVDRLMEGYHPATLSVFECPVQVWNDVQLGQNKMIDLQAPIDYNAPDGPTRWM